MHYLSEWIVVVESLQVEGYQPSPDAVGGNAAYDDIRGISGVVRRVSRVDVAILRAWVVGRGVYGVSPEDRGVSGYGAA